MRRVYAVLALLGVTGGALILVSRRFSFKTVIQCLWIK